MAAWEIKFKIKAVFDENGWHSPSKDEYLHVAVRDPAGQFSLFTDEPLPNQIYLIVDRDTRSNLINGIYQAPPDMVPVGVPVTDAAHR